MMAEDFLSSAPYPGLRPFGRDENDIFFGREEQTDQLLERLEAHRFLAVIGPSGCGKSSLVRAGMVSALETGFMASAGVAWRIAEMRPGDRPMMRLAEALLAPSVLGSHDGGDGETALGFIYASLRRGPMGLAEVVREAALPKGENLLLLVDQFEEIFRYRKDGDPDEADAFVALLLRCAEQREAPIYVVLTMRSDFLGDCALFLGLPEALNDGQFLTPRLDRDQQRDAIALPVRLFGGEMEPALVNRIVNEIGADPDQLPLMQHLLMCMWNHARDRTQRPGASAEAITVTLEDYESVGGLDAALSNDADEAFAELDEQQQRTAAALFRCLTVRGTEQRDTRRPVRLGQVAAVSQVQPREVATVVDVFRQSNRHFLTPPSHVPLEPDVVLDISHESVIRQWDRLKGWVEEEARSAETYHRLLQTARLWRGEIAELWGPLDLANGLDWRRREQPTAAWADRYGGDFELAMGFLDASEEADKEKQRQEEAQRLTKLRRTQRQLAMALLGLVVIGILAGWTVRAERGRADAEALAADQAISLAEVEAEKRAEAEKRVEAEKLAKTGALELAEAQKKVASEARRAEDEATRAADEARRAEDEATKRAEAEAKAATEATKRAEAEAKAATEATRRAKAEAKAATEATKRAEAEENAKIEVSRSAFESLVKQASLLASLEDYAAAREALDKTKLFDNWVPDQRRHARNGVLELVGMMGGRSDQPYEGAGVPLADAAVSPDGRLLATVGERGTVALFDTSNGSLVSSIEGAENSEQLTQVVFEPDGQWIMTAGLDGRIVVRDATDLTTIRQWKAADAVWAMALTPDGRRMATAGPDGRITIWDPESGRPVAPKSDENRVGDVIVGLVGVLTPDADGRGTGKGPELRPIRDLAVSSDGRLLAGACYDHTVKIWDIQSGKALTWLVGHGDHVIAVAFHPGGRILASGSDDNTVRLWDVETRQTVHVMRGHTNTVFDLIFTDGGQRLVSASADTTLRVWDTESGKTLRVLQDHTSIVTGLTADEDSMLFSCSSDHTVRRWTSHLAANQPQMRIIEFDDQRPCSATVAPDGRSVAVGLESGGMRMYALPDGSPLWQTKKENENNDAHGQKVKRLTFSPDGQYLASASFDDMVRVWHADNGELEATFKCFSNGAQAVAFSPNAKVVVAAGVDGRAAWLERRTGEKHYVRLHDELAYTVAFDESGDRLLTVGVKKTKGRTKTETVLWEVEGASPPKAPLTIDSTADQVLWAALSPDGSRAALVGRNPVVRILSTNNGDESLFLHGHKNTVYRAIFTPDGAQIATVSGDGTVRVWDLEFQVELFAITLPTEIGSDSPVWDFDFRAVPNGDCWVAVPLTTQNRVVLYHFTGIFEPAGDERRASR